MATFDLNNARSYLTGTTMPTGGFTGVTDYSKTTPVPAYSNSMGTPTGVPKMQPVPAFGNTPSSFGPTSGNPTTGVDASGNWYNPANNAFIANTAKAGATGNDAAWTGAPTGTGQYGTNVFSDPATQPYEQLLNSVINKYNTPYTPPDYQNTLDALKSYITRLNGPAYTPDQMGLLQTQALDPIMQQRDAARQQIINHFASRGFTPDSGPVQQALLQSDQNFQQQATTARANVANNAIGLQNQNMANAAGLQTQLPGLETGLNTYNLGNANTAASLAGIIPTLAQTRLTGASNAAVNPTSLINPFLEAQQQGLTNGAAYSQQLQQALPYILKAFGLG